MEICTTDEFFDFIGAEEDVRNKKKSFIEFLIKAVTKELEESLGRKLHKEEFTDLELRNNINCVIFPKKIYLKYKYRDIYKIDKLYINNVENLNYILNNYTGCILFNNNKVDIKDEIKISGSLGLVDSSEEVTADLKMAGLELIAVKSRLWTRNIYTLEGTVQTLVLDI